MAFSQTNLRSISLPSRLDQVFESEFEKLKNFSATSESIQSGILGLAELYNSVEELSQKSDVHRDGVTMEDSLSRSVDLLDACTAIKEMLQLMRENVHSLQSALRRKGDAQSDVASYFCFRKRMQKTLTKTLKGLKKSEAAIAKGASPRHAVEADGEFGFVLRQLAAVTISVFKKVLEFLTYSAAPSGWSMMSKLVSAKSAGKEGGALSNEVENVDLALSFLQGKTRSDGSRVLDAQRSLQIVDDVVEGFEGGFERLFRELVRSRVTLLNILTDQ